MTAPFLDRRDAGRALARALREYAGRTDLVVLGLPRGGIPVAYEVAQALSAPLDVFVVRKLGVPGQEELAMGAIASGGVRVLNEDVIERLRIKPHLVDNITRREAGELARRERLYRDHRPPAALDGRTVILVDDGLATGATMLAAVRAVRARGAARVVVAVPVGAHQACRMLAEAADDCLCVESPFTFMAVGQAYEDFSQTSDGEVRSLLAQAPAYGSRVED